MQTSLVAVCLLSSLVAVYSAGWNYGSDATHGGLPWTDDTADGAVCGTGTHQSPIDTPGTLAAGSLVVDAALDGFEYGHYRDTSDSWTIKNNGHTLQVDVGGNRILSGGALPGEYKLAQFHFHWGIDDTKGSEHTHNGRIFPLELHFVHYHTRNADLTAAVGENLEDSLAVLGVMFEISPRDNAVMATLLENAQTYKDNSESMTPLDLTGLLPMYTDYYRYMGGLTTPTCNEIVVWTLFTRPLPISESQMDIFRALFNNADGEPTDRMVNNFRPVQGLNGRIVTMSTKPVNSAPLLISSTLAVILTAVATFVNYH